MTHYWVVRVAGGPVEGPYSAADLRDQVARGMLARDALVSAGGAWHPASSVGGLFAPGEEAASPAAAPAAAGPSPAPAPSEQAVAAPPAATAFGHGPPGRPRRLGWFIILAAMLTALSVATQIVQFVEIGPIDWSAGVEELMTKMNRETPISSGMGCFQILLSLALWVSALVWVYTVHREIHDYTLGAHGISPGLALGLCFVPIFSSVFWWIYMPYQLAQTILRHAPPGAIAPPLILTMLILAVVPGCCAGGWGLNWLFTAIAMHFVQRGLNATWAAARTAGA